jgi:hypothetical protein
MVAGHAVARRQCESKSLESMFSILSAICAEPFFLLAANHRFTVLELGEALKIR